MTKPHLAPAWSSTIEAAMQAALDTRNDLDGRAAGKRLDSAAKRRYLRRADAREAALVDSIATHGIK